MLGQYCYAVPSTKLDPITTYVILMISSKFYQLFGRSVFAHFLNGPCLFLVLIGQQNKVDFAVADIPFQQFDARRTHHNFSRVLQEDWNRLILGQTWTEDVYISGSGFICGSGLGKPPLSKAGFSLAKKPLPQIESIDFMVEIGRRLLHSRKRFRNKMKPVSITIYSRFS